MMVLESSALATAPRTAARKIEVRIFGGVCFSLGYEGRTADKGLEWGFVLFQWKSG